MMSKAVATVSVGYGLSLVHVGEDGRVCFVDVEDHGFLDDQRMTLDDASQRFLVPALAQLRQLRLLAERK